MVVVVRDNVTEPDDKQTADNLALPCLAFALPVPCRLACFCHTRESYVCGKSFDACRCVLIGRYMGWLGEMSQ